jgi:membrane-associated phospholipid phosphatase
MATLAARDRGRIQVSHDDSSPSPRRVGIAMAVFVGLLIMSTVLGGLAEAIERQTLVVGWDDRVEEWAATEASGAGTTALRVITHFGDTVAVIALAVVVVVALLWVGHRRLALFLTTVVVGQWAIANWTKEIVKRARPDLDPLTSFSGFSFPSGHSTAAASTYLALAIILISLRPSWWRPALIASAVTIAVAVAASRALLGVHWFSDVVGGLVLGWTWCLLCAVCYDVLRRRPLPSGSMSTSTSSPSTT